MRVIHHFVAAVSSKKMYLDILAVFFILSHVKIARNMKHIFLHSKTHSDIFYWSRSMSGLTSVFDLFSVSKHPDGFANETDCSIFERNVLFSSKNAISNVDGVKNDSNSRILQYDFGFEF